MPKPFNPRDAYAKQARQEGFRARSAYKLRQILKKYPILKPGDTVLDIGAAPGSWLQVCSEIIGNAGLAVGVDLQPINRIAKNVATIVGDITDKQTIDELAHYAPFDAILSDAAPKTSGIKMRDQAQSAALVEAVLALSPELLAPGGSLVVKIFQGADLPAIQKQMRSLFAAVHVYKPPASRDRSFETYVIGRYKKSPRQSIMITEDMV